MNYTLNFFKSTGTVFNFSGSDFNLAKSAFLAKSDISTPIAFFKSDFVA